MRASRIGVLPTPSSALSAASLMTSPGAMSSMMSRCRSASYARSASEVLLAEVSVTDVISPSVLVMRPSGIPGRSCPLGNRFARTHCQRRESGPRLQEHS
ncbi:Uncharacterised protein [Mycobacteroides abscessus subsp. abscessus]|nr:Uncharacterised protein [Mycobacteroides abscessus subsp. abscessus]